MDGYRLAVEATTVVRSSCPSYSYVNHGNPGTRRFAIDDPKGFLKTNPCPLIVDEVQRVPELLSWIQVTIDERPGKGLFIPTGSSQPGLGAAVSQSLAGRTSLMHLLPLSLEELSLAGSRPDRNTCLVKGFLPRMYQENQPASQAARAPLLGGMFENMVVVELIKSLWNRGKRDSLCFYRDSVGHEVDVVIERQRIASTIEIKASETFSSDFLRNGRFFNATVSSASRPR